MANYYLPPVIQIPSSLLITAATQSLPMVITVQVGNPSTEVDTYIVGMAVRLLVPRTYGMYQANGLTASIIAINGSNFTLNINSTQFDAFVVPIISSESPASISPAGSRNLQYNNNTNRVPFQSYNNVGN